ncbi:MAG: hypothetical protein HYY08_00905 [Firmicutes bacterium]|nr:hypothetical protein [Bacillota bacterium]
MLDEHIRFLANDEIVLINAISQTELTAKKADLYAGLAKDNNVRKFFEARAMLMKKVSDDLRKHLDRIGGS